jgi:cell division protein FtsL
MNETKPSETKPKKMVRRSIAITLGIVCIILVVVGSVGALTYIMPMINDKNNTISSLNSQISQLESNVTNLQNQIASANFTIKSLTYNVTTLQEQLNSILNGSTSLLGIIASDPSAWVNRTVTVEGNLGFARFWVGGSFLTYWDFELSSGSQTIRVALNSSQYEWFMNNFDKPGGGSAHVMIYGVVKRGEFYVALFARAFVTYYIEAQAVEPL